MADTLTPFPDDWSAALCIAAHPDDLEYGTASAVAAWTGAGRTVGYVLLTAGEAGIDDLDPAECGPLREEEERAGAIEVGVTQVEFLGYPDGVLEYGLAMRRDLARVIRRVRPTLLSFPARTCGLPGAVSTTPITVRLVWRRWMRREMRVIAGSFAIWTARGCSRGRFGTSHSPIHRAPRTRSMSATASAPALPHCGHTGGTWRGWGRQRRTPTRCCAGSPG